MALVIWEDSRIRAGARWRNEIDQALSEASIAVLMVSADYLASDFVMNKEIPALLRKAQISGTVIMPLLITPSLFEQSALGCFQAVNSPETQLSKLNPYKREEILAKLAISIAGRIQINPQSR